MTVSETQWQESVKLMYDLSKQLTAISAGLPVIIAGFVASKAFPSGQIEGTNLLVGSLVCLVAAILCALVSMFTTTWLMRQPPPKQQDDKLPISTPFQALVFIVTAAFLVSGIIFFLLFAKANLPT